LPTPPPAFPLANATVTAYAIDANGAVASTPLSGAGQRQKRLPQGNYTLNIPHLTQAG